MTKVNDKRFILKTEKFVAGFDTYVQVRDFIHGARDQPENSDKTEMLGFEVFKGEQIHPVLTGNIWVPK